MIKKPYRVLAEGAPGWAGRKRAIVWIEGTEPDGRESGRAAKGEPQKP